MVQLTQFLQQLRSLYAGMTPQSRLLAILLTAALAVSSTFLVQGYLGSNGAMVYLFDGKSLSEEDLDKIEIALSSASLRRYDRTGNRIKVPNSTKDEYYKAIADGKAVPDGMGSAVEAALNGNTFLEPSRITDAKVMNGKLRDLADALKKKNAIIEDAKVTYDEKRVGFSSQRKQTASVGIKTRGGKPLTAEQSNGIRQFIVSSFAGLRPSDVTLLDLSNLQASTISDDPAGIAQEKYYQMKRQRIQELKEQAENLLVDYGKFRLEVNVDLDPTLSEETDTLSYNDKPTTIQSTTTKKDSTNQKYPPQGRPGTEPNATTAMQGKSLSNSIEQNNVMKEQTENDKRVAGSTLTRTEKAGLQITRVLFTVSLPDSYYRKVALNQWQNESPDNKDIKKFSMTEQQLKKIKDDVESSIQKKLTPLLPKGAAGEDKLPKVTVTDYVDIPEEELPPPPFSQVALMWLSEAWQTIALLGVVGIALVSLRSFATSATGSNNDADFERGFDLPLDDASDIDLSSLTDEENDSFVARSETDENGVPKLRMTGGDVKNDLTTLVRENPDAAATMLRNWIGGT
ncbi:MAG: flagellar M-ring protein FliF C-terminal domain-containing protein [Pirellula sp.]